MQNLSLNEPSPYRLSLIADFIRNGSGLLMVGGYLTFQGIQAKGNYKGSLVEDVLPVVLQATDDRREEPQGVTPDIVNARHPVAAACPTGHISWATTARHFIRRRICWPRSVPTRSSPCVR